jgi:hypothetical protein
MGKKKRPRMGRPPLGDDAKTVSIAVKVSRRELREWRNRARKAGLPLRTYLLAPRREELERGE